MLEDVLDCTVNATPPSETVGVPLLSRFDPLIVSVPALRSETAD
jgi:hypothetical protein